MWSEEILLIYDENVTLPALALIRFLKYFIQLFFLLVGIQNLGLSFLCNSRHFNYISNQIKSVEEGQGEMLEERLRVEGRTW